MHVRQVREDAVYDPGCHFRDTDRERQRGLRRRADDGGKADVLRVKAPASRNLPIE